MPKNIVLLSDGTGNSAARPFKTNVWRLYQALDITPPPTSGRTVLQIASYDAGVGTGSIRPLALLGQAIGIGLAGNVKDLYTFLCRNYEPHDNIYLIGFSRGAFTARILAGLILKCGLVTAPSESELRQRVKLAYAEYKRDAARRATATRPGLFAGRILGGSRKGQQTDHIKFNFDQYFPRIRFIGVWDTVDAYGMPVDELKMAIDHHIWPMTLADRRLSPYIDRACHALSADDERPTFQPVLWTDPDPNDQPNRLTQVWFAGVHANVGGGYPDDGLAYVTLQWMMGHAQAAGLRFYPTHVVECDARANANGQQYDSRAGLAGYYRYGPRDISGLCDDVEHGVRIATPLIHRYVLDRIGDRRVAYAPVSLPVRYQEDGAAVMVGTGPYAKVGLLAPRETNRGERATDMDAARDAIFRRAAAYFVTVVLTVILTALPGIDMIAATATWQSLHLASVLSAAHRQILALFDALPGGTVVATVISKSLVWLLNKQVLPAWSSTWFHSFVGHPRLFLVCAVIVAWLFVRKSEQLQQQVFARAEYAWRRV